VPAEKRLVVAEADALAFACNAVNVGRTVILNQASAPLRQHLEARGFSVLETPLTEFLKAGGAAKCLTQRLDEPRLLTAAMARTEAEPLDGARSPLNRTIRLQGHLLDSGLINRALDRIVEGGGSFQVLDFALGQQRHSPSSAAIRVSAPDGEVMADLMARLIDLGALATQDDESDASLAKVGQDGVAPDDFYVSTIYPTEVRLKGRWQRVERQRMDGALVVGSGESNSEEAQRVECRLLRDLRAGEQVVVGVEGLRTLRPEPAREGREAREAEFSFMVGGLPRGSVFPILVPNRLF
jgi:hypothetical protein